MLEALILTSKKIGSTEPAQFLQAFKRMPSEETLTSMAAITEESASELIDTGSTVVGDTQYALEPEIML